MIKMKPFFAIVLFILFSALLWNCNRGGPEEPPATGLTCKWHCTRKFPITGSDSNEERVIKKCDSPKYINDQCRVRLVLGHEWELWRCNDGTTDPAKTGYGCD